VTATSTPETPLQDFGACHPWGDGYAVQFNRFRQGHIVENIPILFIGSPARRLWMSETEVVRDSIEAEIHALMEKGAPLRHGMVTTQGCDIGKKNHAWISVAPTYDAVERLPASKISQVASNSINYLLPLAPPWREEGQRWVADLRIEISVEKTVLLDRTPLAAYANNDDYLKVAERLAFLRRRSDIADKCIDAISQPFFDWIKGQGTETQTAMFDALDHVRIWQDDPGSPTKAKLYVILKAGQTDHARWDAVIDHVYETATSAGLSLQPTKIATMLELSAAEFHSSQPARDESA
jgi:hypothetical protein